VHEQGPRHHPSHHGPAVDRQVGRHRQGRRGQGILAPVTDEALAKGVATVDYKFSNPVTKQIEAKTALAQKVADDEVCAVGYYK